MRQSTLALQLLLCLAIARGTASTAAARASIDATAPGARTFYGPVCKYARHTPSIAKNLFCSNDHGQGKSVGSMSMRSCSMLCGADTSCAFFELGCYNPKADSGECLLLTTCVLSKSSTNCGSVVEKIDRASCRVGPAPSASVWARGGGVGAMHGPINLRDEHDSASASATPFDFRKFETQIFPRWLERFRTGDGPGNYTIQRGHPTCIYGTTDVLYYKYILGQVDTLSEAEKDEWAALINSFQDASSGQFIPKPFERWAGLFPWHTSGTAISALSLLGRRPRFAPRFAEQIAEEPASWAPWIERFLNASAVPNPGKDPTTDDDVIWHSSHAIAAVPCALQATSGAKYRRFFDWYFAFLERAADPASGFWTGRNYTAPPSFLQLGSSFHMIHAYEFFGARGLAGKRPLGGAGNESWPNVPAVLNWTLALQQPNGFWQKNYSFCPDVDGTFTAARSSLRLAKARWAEVRGACVRYLRSAERTLNDESFVMEAYNTTHPLHGALLAIRECATHWPELVRTHAVWRSMMDDACFY